MRGHWNPEYDTIARIPPAFWTSPIEQHFSRPVDAVVDACREIKIAITGTLKRNDRECGWYDPTRRSRRPTPTELRRIEIHLWCPLFETSSAKSNAPRVEGRISARSSRLVALALVDRPIAEPAERVRSSSILRGRHRGRQANCRRGFDASNPSQSLIGSDARCAEQGEHGEASRFECDLASLEPPTHHSDLVSLRASNGVLPASPSRPRRCPPCTKPAIDAIPDLSEIARGPCVQTPWLAASVRRCQSVAGPRLRCEGEGVLRTSAASHGKGCKPSVEIGLAVPDQGPNLHKLWPSLHDPPLPQCGKTHSELPRDVSLGK